MRQCCWSSTMHCHQAVGCFVLSLVLLQTVLWKHSHLCSANIVSMISAHIIQNFVTCECFPIISVIITVIHMPIHWCRVIFVLWTQALVQEVLYLDCSMEISPNIYKEVVLVSISDPHLRLASRDVSFLFQAQALAAYLEEPLSLVAASWCPALDLSVWWLHPDVQFLTYQSGGCILMSSCWPMEDSHNLCNQPWPRAKWWTGQAYRSWSSVIPRHLWAMI